ncbi:MAG TPA: hypothetical protein VGO62_21295 [Myxococcota bacterium]|jgi:hypothetical protein
MRKRSLAEERRVVLTCQGSAQPAPRAQSDDDADDEVGTEVAAAAAAKDRLNIDAVCAPNAHSTRDRPCMEPR